MKMKCLCVCSPLHTDFSDQTWAVTLDTWWALIGMSCNSICGDWNRLHVPYLFLWFPRWVISTYLTSNKHTPFIVNTTVKRVLELWSRQKWEPFYSYHSGNTLIEYTFCSYLTGNEPLFSLLFSYTTYAHSIKEFLQLIVCIYLEDALRCIYMYHVIFEFPKSKLSCKNMMPHYFASHGSFGMPLFTWNVSSLQSQ